MSAETPLKDLPKVDPTLKGQLEGFSAVNLKKIETEEKIHLPNKEGEYRELFYFFIFFKVRRSKKNY